MIHTCPSLIGFDLVATKSHLHKQATFICNAQAFEVHLSFSASGRDPKSDNSSLRSDFPTREENPFLGFRAPKLGFAR
ncbi:hypothetical protein L3X38_023084 [Prunus dulcis]|uniref:Uncharacterized protein n=1 Tax=Prunus dulcis TaxID=3755 RepID=A0AAD4VXA2_PRUDU|nr:hypothetical protein L3X38_023084 [Prunus dulcis]